MGLADARREVPLDHLCAGADNGKRGAQLMASVGDELSLEVQRGPQWANRPAASDESDTSSEQDAARPRKEG